MSLSKSNDRVCVFCGGSLGKNRAKEHIFPKWLQERYQIAGLQLDIVLHTEPRKKRPLTFGSYLSGFVCKQCNTGWMSRLESRTFIQPVLIPLIDGTFAQGRLEWYQCDMLALWIYKTALMIQSVALGGVYVPKEHFTAINPYGRFSIPKDVWICIAESRNEFGFSWLQSRNWKTFPSDIPLDDAKAVFERSYKISMRVGHLLARVHYFPEPEWDVTDYLYLDDSIRYICPLLGESVTWPPSSSVEGIVELDGSLVVRPPHLNLLYDPDIYQ